MGSVPRLSDAQIAAIEREIITEGLRLRQLKNQLLEEIKNLEDLSNKEIQKKEYFSQNKHEAEETKRLTEIEVRKIQALTKTLEETPRVNISLISFFTEFGFNHVDPLKFEELMLKVFQALGFDGKLTPPSGDDGIDIILTDLKGIKVIAQCKRFAEQQNINPKDVREFLGSIVHAEAKYGFFITTTTFSDQAKSFCEEKNIILIDGPKLIKLFLLAVQVEINKKSTRNYIVHRAFLMTHVNPF